MLDNVDFDKMKKNSFRLIGTLALTGILAFNLTGCINNPNDFSNNNAETTTQEEVVVKAPCAMEIIGEENFYKDGEAPHFSLFKMEEETGRWRLYGTYICDGREKSTHLSKGKYCLYSKDIGKYEFNVTDLDEEYKIVVDYNNMSINFDKIVVDNTKSK